MSGTTASSLCSMSSLPLCILMQPPLSQRTQQDEVLRHSRRGWISVHDCQHGKVGVNALAWLEQLPHGEVWLHAFRAVIQESSGLSLLRPEGLLPRRPLQAAKPVPTGRTQYAHKQKTS